ncbi:MAG: ATP-binding protein [Thermoanaerobaculales bacterium]|jgi:signal transduction histidine kinase|nr:ATP-binding protein [Thermoanaerobaculales bacterium]
MRKQGTITGRHVAFAVLVVVVINAQLTWWIIYSTGQARERLELERSLLAARAEVEADRLAATGVEDRSAVPHGLEIADGPGADPPRPVAAIAGDGFGRVVRPTEAEWLRILDEYRRRIVMMVSEGAFFAVLLLVFMGLMWRTFRREVQLERQHRNFLSAITHELKSPIAAIKIALETVVSGRADEVAARRFVTNALADTDRLDLLVQKVLHATRYGNRTGGLSLRRRSLNGVVEATLEAFRPRLSVEGAVVSASIEDDVWAMIDDESIAIVVSNLLENALKYGGDPAEIEIVLRRRRDDAVLEVTDNGGGIEEEAVPMVFNRFFRAGDEMTRTTRGTGLGLFLVQRIVMAHHGRVEVARTGPDGTTMRVVLPVLEDGE